MTVVHHEPDAARRNRILFLFNIYSYAESLCVSVLNLLPHPVRILCYRFVFGHLGRRVTIDYGCYFRYPGQIYIGDNVTINRRCELFASHFKKDVRITIGHNTALAPHVKIFTADHDYHTIDLTDIGESVTVGSHVLIGGGTIILPGITIGDGAIIGAGSVVSRDIPAWTVAVGNPARVIKKRAVLR